MKLIRTAIAAISIVSFAQGTMAQTEKGTGAGIYMTASDYAGKNISHQITCGSRDKIKYDYLFNAGRVKVIHDGKAEAFSKKELYGFRDCAGRDYRFINNSAYQLLDTAGFYIYSHTEIMQAKGYQPSVTRYYFSTVSTGPVQALTIDNLEKAFPGNKAFHYMLDMQFKTDRDLVAYDSFLHMYKIKYLFEQSQSAKNISKL